MTTFIYKQTETEPSLWTVGYTGWNGKFEPESDHPTAAEAAEHAAWLNGGQVPAAQVREVTRATPENLPEVTDDDLNAIPEAHRFVLAMWMRQRCIPAGAPANEAAALLGPAYVSGHNGGLSGAAAGLVEPGAIDDVTWVVQGRHLNTLDAWWRDHAEKIQARSEYENHE